MNGLGAWPHWVIVPVVLPLLAGAVTLLLERRSPGLARAVSIAATLGLLPIGLLLLTIADTGIVTPYLVGNWQAPFGIALALDRLSALMLMLTAAVASIAIVYASGGDDRRGPLFHPLFQFQLMGLNGAFLTADLFNLFVFFEVLLSASYGLLLHGAGAARLKASIHYVVFNLAGSALFLIAVSMLYGLTGTLNMADLGVRMALLPDESAGLARTAALLLLVVFSVKAALLPLYFWLPATYGAASAPVAALFAIMTKVGVYAIARTTTLIFGAAAGVAADVASPWLAWLAMATLALAGVGALAAGQLRTLCAYLVVASAGTLLLGVGLARHDTLSAVLFYLVNSTLVAAGLFLLADRIAAARPGCGDRLHGEPPRLEGRRLAAAFFVCAIAAASMPPLAGFLGKALLLSAARDHALGPWMWGVVLVTGLAIVVALARAGAAIFWGGEAPDPLPRARPVADDAVAGTRPAHRLALAMVIAGLAAASAGAGYLASYTHATALQLFSRAPYLDAVLEARPVAAAIDVRREMREAGREKPAQPLPTLLPSERGLR